MQVCTIGDDRTCCIVAREVQSRYRVLAPRFGGIGCKHSTDTYPGIMMAVTQGAHPIIAHVIARTILSHPLLPDGHRWAVTTDMRAVDNVYRLLKIENYAYLREMTLHRWLITHWQVPAFVALLLLGLLLHSWRTSVLVRKRTAQLSSALTERENAQAEIQSLSERMESLHKVTVVGQLSSMVAHELAQPLSVIQYYCESQRDILKNKPINERLLDISRVGIEKALARTRSIVDKVRSYNRGNTSRDDSVDVEASVKRVCATLNAELLRKTSFNVLCKPALIVRADKLEFELILTNLLKNALEASHEASHPVVIVEAFPCGSISNKSTFFPSEATVAAMLTAEVVFPTPPFWFAKDIIMLTTFLSVLQICEELSSGSCVSENIIPVFARFVNGILVF